VGDFRAKVRLLHRMRLGYFHDPNAGGSGVRTDGPLVLALAAEYAEVRGAAQLVPGPALYYTCNAWPNLGDTRIATYVAIALDQIPHRDYFELQRTPPPTDCREVQPPGGTWVVHDEGLRVDQALNRAVTREMAAQVQYRAGAPSVISRRRA
jgi:hypothetical protein